MGVDAPASQLAGSKIAAASQSAGNEVERPQHAAEGLQQPRKTEAATACSQSLVDLL
eukprot:CAMPEP_0195106374 /NCGR_PEP_ID=MMETSP0448-20130528/80419_1 /TAXON_ID=66468 /ORGANISM="Heterocapsa triquestra, Strain CCMP 448" /LENGTH=56 /DNA_ID=CAMNT_0040142611 /DNA_START=61 /DNA_END=228 /DNA_ORIENTATION=-